MISIAGSYVHLLNKQGINMNYKGYSEASQNVKATVKTDTYSWGKMKTVRHGSSFSIPLHPEHQEAIAKLKDQQDHKFKDETGRNWTAKRDGDDIHFQAANGGNKTKVAHKSLTEERYEKPASAYRPKPGDQSYEKYHPVAPVPDKKYIKGTPENKALKALKKPINGMPTNNVKEEAEEIDELSKTTLGDYVKAASRDSSVTRKMATDFEHRSKRAKNKGMKAASASLADKFKNDARKRQDNVDKAVDRLTKEETMPQSFKGFLLTLSELTDKQKKIDKNKNGKLDAHDFHLLRKEEDLDEKEGTGASDPLANRQDYAKRHGTGQVYKKTHAGDKTGMSQAYAYDIKRSGPKGKLPEEVELEEGYDKSSEHHKNARKMAKDYDGKATFHPNGHAEVKMRSIVHGHSTVNPQGTTLMSGEDLAKRASKEHGKGKVAGNIVHFKEEVENIDEANHRELASIGKMHPMMAKHMTKGHEMDFYAQGSGDKISGVVKHNDGKEVHIAANKNDKRGAGAMHKFKVSGVVESKEMLPFEPDTKLDLKKPKNPNRTGMDTARALARKAMKQKMKEEFNIEITEEQAADLCDAASLDETMHMPIKDIKDLKNSKVKKLDNPKSNSEKKSYREFVELLAPQIEEGSEDEQEVTENAFDYKNIKGQTSSGKYDVKQDGNRTVVTRKYNPETGHSTGTDDEEKPDSEKRGRGRPAGAKSGAKQQGSEKKSDYRGIDRTTHALHLPNRK
jgi:hypothetical protein